jgi:hypothetical protein
MLAIGLGGSADRSVAAVKVTKSGEAQWTLESPALRVILDGNTATFSVLDKRCGHEWRAWYAPPAGGVAWTMPRAPEGVVVDGVVGDGEWPGAGLGLTGATSLTEGAAPASDADFSASVHAAWSPAGLVLAARVRDDRVLFPATGERTWWEWDSIEFWMGGQQHALLPAPPAGRLIAVGAGDVAGAKVAARLVEGGYEIEALAPWPEGRAPAAGALPFAIGINDADAPGKRTAQLYFPKTWRHSVPETFAQARLEGAPAPAAGAQPQARVRDVEPLKTGDGLHLTTPARAVSDREMWPAAVTVRLVGDAEVAVTVDHDPRDIATELFRVFGPLGQAEPAEVYAAAYSDGIAVPDDDRDFSGAWWWVSAGLDMPWIGYGTAAGPGYLVLAETPDGALFRGEPRGDGGRIAPDLYFIASKGKLAEPRAYWYAFFDRGGFVAMCKWYRAWARRTGLLVTAAEKMRARPQLERIRGAPDFWGIDPGIATDLRRYGVRHAIVNDGWPAEVMERVKGLGYLVSRYDNYEDMLPGPREEYGKGPIPDDVMLNADGTRMTAWQSWDKKTQWMKRCSVLYPEAARAQVPKDLAEHPYNARFIDVTTACGLRECYDPAHPCTFAQDREARQKLAAYVSGELKLVLGGEHGQWWGVPYYDYWEGMQSGNFYSWPAGYVGESLPKTRADIGDRYLTYGIGNQRRVPLWQLVFGDCVLATWYWGDSTGHLYSAAPDLDERKDCLNLLYGTVPLFWTSQPYSFRWTDPNLRLRLLQSYYVTCPVQEQTGWSEMTDYRFLTADRAVHQSRFANGIAVTANFGEKPWVAEAGGKRYELPQFGFLATGRCVLAYRALEGGRTVTLIATPTAVYCDAAGKTADLGPVRCDGRVALEILREGQVRVIRLSGSPPALRFGALGKGWAPRKARAYSEDDGRSPADVLRAGWDGDRLLWPAKADFGQVLWGPVLARPDLTVAGVRAKPATVSQGEKARVTVELRNNGDAGTGTAWVALYLDRAEKGRELGRRRTDVGPMSLQTVIFDVPTADMDGRHRLVAVVGCAEPDINDRNNQGAGDLEVVANPKLWPYRLSLEVAAPNYSHLGYGLEAPVDLAACGAAADVTLDAEAVRAVRVEGEKVVAEPAAQFEPAEGFDGRASRRGTLVVVDDFLAGRAQRYLVLIGTARQRTRTSAALWYDARSRTVRTPAYELSFEAQGRAVQWRNLLGGGQGAVMAQHVATSDPASEWSAEAGKAGEVKLVRQGPARVVVEVRKTLADGTDLRKTWAFYAGYMALACDLGRGVAVWTRTGVVPGCEYADNMGNRATVDAQGDAENVETKLPGYQWYACYNDRWAFSSVGLSAEPAGVSYWDAGVGDVGFTTSQAKGLRATYVVHGGEASPAYAERDYQALAEPLTAKVSGG